MESFSLCFTCTKILDIKERATFENGLVIEQCLCVVCEKQAQTFVSPQAILISLMRIRIKADVFFIDNKKYI